MPKFIKKSAAFVASLALVGSMFAGTAFAAPPAFGLQPFEFVGAFEDCGPGYPAGTDTVTAKWDNTTGNPSPSILLQKLGLTSNCAAAGVDVITSLEGGPLSALTELNYDFRNDGHCGAGAPRYNIQTSEGTVFLGCAAAPKSATSDAAWTHVEYNNAALLAAFAGAGVNPLTATLEDLYMIFDEGTDTPTGGSIVTAGTVYVDNFSVNNQSVGSSTSPLSKEDCKKDGWKNMTGSNGQPFKNQGDCVSYVATGGKNLPAGL